VFDLDAGPVTVTLPGAGKRFRSMIVIDEDQYVPAVVYEAGRFTYTRDKIGTRYLMLALRTLIDPNDPKDVERVHGLQDATKIEQPGGPGRFEIPTWDPLSHKKVRDALLVLASTLPDSDRGFGTKEQIDPVRRLILSASAWGGNPDKEAKYLNVFPSRNDGKMVYSLTVKDVPVEGSGRSASITPRAISRRTRMTRTPSTMSPLRRTPTAQSACNSAAATPPPPRPTVSRSCPVGTTWCASIVRDPRF
jgi:hypothetical protein